MKDIFFLTCLNIKPSEEDGCDGLGIIEHSRCWGWYEEYEDARHDIENNVCDMHECLYKYALIERVEERTHPFPKKITWFKWNRDTEKYEECEEPEPAKRIVGFCLG